MEQNSLGGSKYFVTFVDDYSRLVFVYFLKAKSEVFEKFKQFVALVENFTGKTVRILRSDRGGEYESREFQLFCAQKGIDKELTVPGSSQQNGVAERMNRTLMNKATAILRESKLGTGFWAEALSTAVHVRNRTPTSSVDGKTPMELWSGEIPDVSHLRVFGCLADVLVPKSKRGKFDSKSERVVFIGYPHGCKGYKFWNPAKKKIFFSRDAIFHEVLLLQDKVEIDIEENNPTETVQIQGENLGGDTEQFGADNLCGDTEQFGADSTTDNPVCSTYEETFMNSIKNLPPKRMVKAPSCSQCNFVESLVNDPSEPSSIKAAWSSEYSTQWKAATDDEFQSLSQMKTWKLVDKPEGANVVGSRWVFKVKRKSDNSIDRFKARLVAQGYSQKEGVDFDEVFAPVARMTTIRSIISLVASLDLEAHQMDFKTAFLNGDLDHKIYMKQPPGYENEQYPDRVCELSRGLYGLRQAARVWYKKLDGFLLEHGFRRSQLEPSLYIKIDGDSFVVIVVYVDDLLIVSNSIETANQTKQSLSSQFRMTDLGELSYILGLKVVRDRSKGEIAISQESYLQGVLDRFGMNECNHVKAPLEANCKLYKKDSDPMLDASSFRGAIGCLMYAVTCTRPDLAFAVSLLSQFMSEPTVNQWSGIKRVLRYVKRTSDAALVYRKSDKQPIIQGYVDANWAGDYSDRKSHSGYLFFLGGGLVSWKCKKQAVVARSTTEAEYLALSSAVQECLWLKQLLEDINLFNIALPITIHEDNKSAIALAQNPRFSDRTKHIDVAHHFLRERIDDNTITLSHIPTREQIADVMTKSLPAPAFLYFRKEMGIVHRRGINKGEC